MAKHDDGMHAPKTRFLLQLARRLAALSAAAWVLCAAALDVMPQRLSETGLLVDGSLHRVRPDVLPFSPQFALWSDGAAKRRWIYLPAGQRIDATDPDNWRFPVGTRLWKEFGFGHQRVETRFMALGADRQWRYATYVWAADGQDAVLAPERGAVVSPVPEAPGGRVAIPSRADCLLCHDNGNTPVLGFSALQLSAAPAALAAAHGHAAEPARLDLARLLRSGRLDNAAPTWLQAGPDIDAANPTERAVLGYLHANCGHCHNDTGPLASLELALAQSARPASGSAARTLATLLRFKSRYTLPLAEPLAQRIAPGNPAASTLLHRLRSTNPSARMPPLGVSAIDSEAAALVENWIRNLINHQPQGTTP